MAYRTYRRTRPSSGGPGRWMELRRGADCQVCHDDLAAGTRAYWDPRDRTVTCTSLDCADRVGLTHEVWQGSPTSGGYVKTLAPTRTLRDTDGTPLAVTRYGLRRGYEHTGRRCEDAPCCGCCD